MALRRALAEAVGTGFLLCAIIGSGIMAWRLTNGNVGLTLLIDSIATGATLVALVAAIRSLSGAHFNPCVSLAMAVRGELAWPEVPLYVTSQLLGAVAGVATANTMFGLPTVSLSHTSRLGSGQFIGETVATFGLVIVIICCSRRSSHLTSLAVGSYIAGAYWFTSSTSFANPVVTIARTLSDSFAGISPASVLPFVLCQLLGAVAAVGLAAWMLPVVEPMARRGLVHGEAEAI